MGSATMRWLFVLAFLVSWSAQAKHGAGHSSLPDGLPIFRIVTRCLSGPPAAEDKAFCSSVNADHMHAIKRIMRRPQPTDEAQNEMEALGHQEEDARHRFSSFLQLKAQQRTATATATHADAAVDLTNPFPEPVMRWPDKTIRFYFHNPMQPDDPNRLSPTQQVQFSQSAAYYQHYTCIRFEEVDLNYKGHALRVQGRPEHQQYVCSTQYSGYARFLAVPGRHTYQLMRLGESCGLGSVIHETGHVLGMKHTQTRQDRAQFLDILSLDIKPSALPQYEKAMAAYRDVGAYDYGSAMHYPPITVANAAMPGTHQVMLAKRFPERNEDRFQGGMGQRDGLSWADIGLVCSIYKCRPHHRSKTRAPTGCTCPQAAELEQALRRDVVVAVEEPDDEDEEDEGLEDEDLENDRLIHNAMVRQHQRQQQRQRAQSAHPAPAPGSNEAIVASVNATGVTTSTSLLQLSADKPSMRMIKQSARSYSSLHVRGVDDRPLTQLRWCESAFTASHSNDCRIYCRNQPAWKDSGCWINADVAAPLPTQREMDVVSERVEKQVRRHIRHKRLREVAMAAEIPQCPASHTAYVTQCLACEYLINNPFKSKISLLRVVRPDKSSALGQLSSSYRSKKGYIKADPHSGDWLFQGSLRLRTNRSFQQAMHVLRAGKEFRGCCCVKGCRKHGNWRQMFLYPVLDADQCTA